MMVAPIRISYGAENSIRINEQHLILDGSACKYDEYVFRKLFAHFLFNVQCPCSKDAICKQIYL